MSSIQVVIEGIDGSGKTTTVEGLQAQFPGTVFRDRGSLTQCSNMFLHDLPLDLPRETTDGSRTIYIVLDLPAAEAVSRIQLRCSNLGVEAEPWECLKWLQYFRFMYQWMAARYGIYLVDVNGLRREQVIEEVKMVIKSELKGERCDKWLVPNVDKLEAADVVKMEVVTQGWSKIIRRFPKTSRFHLLELIPSVYSHTNQSTGMVPGTDIERRRMTAMSMLLFWLNGIEHTWVYVGKKYILVQALTNTSNSEIPDITDIECIWKRIYGGTDKHRYWNLQGRKTRTGVPAVRPVMDGHFLEYWEPIFRCDLRNPNHVFKLPRDRNELYIQFGLSPEQVQKIYDRVEWYRGEDCPDIKELTTMLEIDEKQAGEILNWLINECKKPWGDYNLARGLADAFIDHDEAERLTLKIGKLMSEVFEPMGLVFIDFCVMLTSDGKRVYGEFSQDCCRVDRIDKNGKPMSLTKDVWRAGGSHPDKSLLLTRYREMSDFIEKTVRQIHYYAIQSIFATETV